MDGVFPKTKVAFEYNGQNLNFPAWEYNEAELKALRESDFVLVSDVKYKIKETIFDTYADALYIRLQNNI